MDASLLQVVKGTLPDRRGIPHVMEWVVDPQTRPYLVSGTKHLKWLERSLPGIEGKTGVIRSIIHPTTSAGFDGMYMQVVEYIAHRGVHCEYGNVHPDTEEGLIRAAEHVLYFLEGPAEYPTNPAHTRIEVLTAESDPVATESIDVSGKTFPVTLVGWLPPRVALVVPEDRGFLGDLHLLGSEYFTVVVHNPARGLGIAAPEGMFDELADRSSESDGVGE